MKSKKHGFTLTELLVTIAIIAVISTVCIVGYVTYINTSENSKADAEALQIQKLIDSAKIVNSRHLIGILESGEEIYTEVNNGIIFFSVSSVDVYKSLYRKGITFSLSQLAGELSGFEGKLIFKPARHFSLEEDGRVLFLSDLTYIADHGFEREIVLNSKSAVKMKADLEIKMIYEIISQGLSQNNSFLLGIEEESVTLPNYATTFDYISYRVSYDEELSKYVFSIEYPGNSMKKQCKTMGDRIEAFRRFNGDFYINTLDGYLLYTNKDGEKRRIYADSTIYIQQQ